MRKPPRTRAAGAAEHRGASRALKILEFLAHTAGDFTLAELSRKLDVPKSSLLALLRTFADHGYLEHRPGGAYRLGPRAIAIGIRPPSERELPGLAGPVLLDLMEQSGETVCLGALAHDAPEIVYLDTVESRQQIRYSARPGERRPLHCTAPGLVVLAFLPAGERERLVRSLRLLPLTGKTSTDREALRARLDEVRQAGVAVSVDEFIAGASAIAAPIFDRRRRVVAACAVVGPTPRLLAQRAPLVGRVRAAGEAVTRRLGLVPDPRAGTEAAP